jgi:hypothetical protein
MGEALQAALNRLRSPYKRSLRALIERLSTVVFLKR